MKALILGDVHLADRPPSLRRAEYKKHIMDKLRWCVQEAKRRDADVIVQLGDLFHVKTPARNSYELVLETHDVLTSAGIPVVIVAGNHDMTHDQIESMATQPLGALGRMSGITLLAGEHPTLPIFAIPYLARWKADLPAHMEQWRAFADVQRLEHGVMPLLITHAPIFPDNEDPPYEYISASDWAGLMEKGVCAYGHIHDPHGIYKPEVGTAVTMVNNGAISRGSLHEKTLKRKPAVTWFDDGEMETVQVPHLPVEEVFLLREHERRQEETSRMTDFLDDLNEREFSAEGSEHVREHVRGLGLDEPVVKAVDDLLEHAEGTKR